MYIKSIECLEIDHHTYGQLVFKGAEVSQCGIVFSATVLKTGYPYAKHEPCLEIDHHTYGQLVFNGAKVIQWQIKSFQQWY